MVVQVYELITCVRRANENAGNLISVVQFLIIEYILGKFRKFWELARSQGRPRFQISKSQIEELRYLGFAWSKIATTGNKSKIDLTNTSSS